MVTRYAKNTIIFGTGSTGNKYMAGVAGFEPATVGLEGRCSIQLSYTPIDVRLYTGKWGGRRVLNPPPPESQSGALPDELRPPSKGLKHWLDQLSSALAAGKLVGVERFELPTSCSQSRRATRLRYTPIFFSSWRERQKPLFSGGRIILTPLMSVNGNMALPQA